MLWLALTLAWAGPGDVSTTGVGTSARWSTASSKGDVDLWLSQRLRWQIGTMGATKLTALVDGRARYDLGPSSKFERSQVRALGVRFESEGLTVDVGRSMVYAGGPRLVDGVQLRVRPVGGLDVGAWAGLAPDLYSTRPAMRPGFGPIVAYQRGWLQTSITGEAVFWDGGVDRAGFLAQARVASEPGWDGSARVDWQLTDGDGRSGLADAAVVVGWRPAKPWRLTALADAYSSLRYLRSEAQDPVIRRFEGRIDAMGIGEGLSQNKRDGRLFQLFGASARLAPGGAISPTLKLKARTRWHNDPKLRFSRVGLKGGVTLFNGSLDVGLDGAVLQYGGEPQGDAGVTLGIYPLPKSALALDTSVRAVINPAFGGSLGWYGDLFADVPLGGPLDLMIGANASREPYFGFADVGYMGFVRLNARIRGSRSAARDGSQSQSPPPSESP